MEPMVFLNVSWMERYEGKVGNDTEMRGGGTFVDKNGFGHEMFNFKKIDGKVFGYVQRLNEKMDLKKLGASQNDEFVDNVLVVFTAKHVKGGTYIVGWYKNATVFREQQNKRNEERKYKDQYFGYYAETDAENATLLSVDERFSFPKVPRSIKGGMGQSNVWYADADLPLTVQFKNAVLEHIERYEKKKNDKKSPPVFRQADIEKRKRIESSAIEVVKREYAERGFKVNSVESENLGWDLEAVYNKVELKIEVKGLSGNKVSIELTPNEFSKMNEHKDSYRLCVVTECLESAALFIFAFSKERDSWISEDGYELTIDQIISARCYA